MRWRVSTTTIPASTGGSRRGEAEIAPGVTAIPTYGHTPGHQSFLVDLDESVGGGGFVFAFDAADLTENIEHELAIGGYVDIDPRGDGRADPPAEEDRRRTGLPAHPGTRPARVARDDGGLPEAFRSRLTPELSEGARGNARQLRVPLSSSDQTSGSNPISRTSCAQRQATANLAAHSRASSREGTSTITNPPMTAFVSGYGRP